MGDLGANVFTILVEGSVSSLLVYDHEPRIPFNIGGKDYGRLALYVLLGHEGNSLLIALVKRNIM